MNQVSGDTKLFEDGVLGKTPTGCVNALNLNEYTCIFVIIDKMLTDLLFV